MDSFLLYLRKLQFTAKTKLEHQKSAMNVEHLALVTQQTHHQHRVNTLFQIITDSRLLKKVERSEHVLITQGPSRNHNLNTTVEKASLIYILPLFVCLFILSCHVRWSGLIDLPQ